MNARYPFTHVPFDKLNSFLRNERASKVSSMLSRSLLHVKFNLSWLPLRSQTICSLNLNFLPVPNSRNKCENLHFEASFYDPEGHWFPDMVLFLTIRTGGPQNGCLNAYAGTWNHVMNVQVFDVRHCISLLACIHDDYSVWSLRGYHIK